MEEEHRQVVVELRASVDSTKEELKRREEEVSDLLEKKELELLTASSSLEIKEREIASLVEAARLAAEEAASVPASPPTVDTAFASGYQPSEEEIAGVVRLQDAVDRLRGERDAFKAERNELRLSLTFSVSLSRSSSSL